MVVSDRQRRILEVLLQRREATAGEIAEEVRISARTVHRDMREIKDILKEYDLVLATKSGKGIAIQGAESDMARFQRMLAHFDTIAYASGDRRTLLLCELLQAFEPIKLYSLAYEINAAIPTVGRDLDEAEPLLGKHGLSLIRRRGYGVEIAGPESAKRRLIEGLALEYLDESDLFGNEAARQHAWPITRRLLDMIGKEHFPVVERIVWKLQEEWPARSSQTAYTSLLLKLSIAVARMRGGHWLEPLAPGIAEAEFAGEAAKPATFGTASHTSSAGSIGQAQGGIGGQRPADTDAPAGIPGEAAAGAASQAPADNEAQALAGGASQAPADAALAVAVTGAAADTGTQALTGTTADTVTQELTGTAAADTGTQALTGTTADTVTQELTGTVADTGTQELTGTAAADTAQAPAGGAARTEELGDPAAPRSAAAYDEERKELQPLLEAFPWAWPEQEQKHVLLLLRKAKEEAESHNAPLLNESGMSAADTAARLAQAVEGRLHIPFGRDESLMDGLIRHMASALIRLRRGEAIRNPLLAQIRKDYAALFEALQSAAAETMRGLAVPDEEIGHLVMHFGASVERWNLFRKVRALIVCTSGIGSSKLLAARIAKELPQIECVGPYSWYDASRIPPDRYDMIISTVDLPLEAGSYMKISPLLTAEESGKLRLFLWNRALGGVPAQERRQEEKRPERRPEDADADDSGVWLRLKRMNEYASAVVRVLEPFDVHELGPERGDSDLRGVISAMLLRTALGDRPDDAAAIAERLVEREKAGSQAIAGTTLALLHTRSDRLQQPVLQLFRLDRPLLLGEEKEAEVRQVVLMLAPLQLDRSMLEVLGEISAMLLLPEFVHLLEEGDAETIKRFVSRELEQFVQSKWRGSDHT